MIEADRVHSTPRRFTPKIVAGTDLAHDEPIRGDDRRENPDLSGKDDPIFTEIERHRKAAEIYTCAVDAVGAFISAPAHLQRQSDAAESELFLCAESLVFGKPKTRAGLIAWAKYLESQFAEDGECWSIPETIK